VAVEDWFHLPLPMQGIKSTSFVFHSVAELVKEPYVGFCGEDNYGCHLELYPRPNGDLYISGCGGCDYVEGDRLRSGGDCEDASTIHANEERVASAVTALRSMTNIINEQQKPDITQACMRPCTADALPVMGRIPGVSGAFVSTGHNCWGILWAPISGLSMAELIATGECTEVDLSPFDPARFRASSEKKNRGRKKEHTPIGQQW
jgi:glycine/D-amino acid oxidase-like deaminating enzyme